MEIFIIGSGNLAYNLVPEIIKNNHKISGIYVRNTQTLKPLAQKYGLKTFNNLENIPDVDLCIIAVTDTAIEEISAQIKNKNIVTIHCSGSTPLNVLTKHHTNCGVIYPTQTFSKQRQTNFKTIPLLVEYSNPKAEEVIKKFANSMSNDVREMSSEQRLNLHLAAVFACNFTNHFYALAKNILDANNVDFNLLAPLIKETAQKAIETQEPAQYQTGPAIREDIRILNQHSQMLKNNKELQQIYNLISQNIIKLKTDGTIHI